MQVIYLLVDLLIFFWRTSAWISALKEVGYLEEVLKGKGGFARSTRKTLHNEKNWCTFWNWSHWCVKFQPQITVSPSCSASLRSISDNGGLFAPPLRHWKPPWPLARLQLALKFYHYYCYCLQKGHLLKLTALLNLLSLRENVTWRFMKVKIVEWLRYKTA